MPDSNTTPTPLQGVQTVVRPQQGVFFDTIEPFRPDLYRYARRLTGSPWDAEDLVQETCMRAFAKLSVFPSDIDNPRHYLFRMMTHCWIDACRRSRPDSIHSMSEAVAEIPDIEIDVEAAAARLLKLPPAQACALLLKDVFDFSLEEIGVFLPASVGAVKALLARARAGLLQAPATQSAAVTLPRPDKDVISRFVAAFNQRDIPGVLETVLPGVRARVIAAYEDFGAESLRSILEHTFTPTLRETEIRAYHGEPVALTWCEENGVRQVQEVIRFRTEGGRIADVEFYYCCPDLLREIGADLGLPVRTQGYHMIPRGPSEAK